jgi:muramoyltetrapeptide carboxypeptidase LdcA involved in peptidoglycan recycling
MSGLSFGHIEQKLVLPIGARATLDADAGTVRVEEGAVRYGVDSDHITTTYLPT